MNRLLRALALSLLAAPLVAGEGVPAGGEFSATATMTTTQGTRSLAFTVSVARPRSAAEALPLKQILETGGQQALQNAISGRPRRAVPAGRPAISHRSCGRGAGQGRFALRRRHGASPAHRRGQRGPRFAGPSLHGDRLRRSGIRPGARAHLYAGGPVGRLRGARRGRAVRGGARHFERRPSGEVAPVRAPSRTRHARIPPVALDESARQPPV